MNDLEEKIFKKLIVKESHLKGKGLFADEDIFKGEFILSFGGVIGDQNSRYSGGFLKSTCIGISEFVMLGEIINDKPDISDFINHSCEPNSGMHDAITVVAIKNILKGEEILCDYSFWEANEEWVMKKKCMCGSNSCRGLINGKYWKEIKTSDKYFNYYSPFIKRRIIENE